MGIDRGPGTTMCDYLTCQMVRGIELIRGEFAQIDGLTVSIRAHLCYIHRTLVLRDFAFYQITPSVTPEGWVYTGDFNQMIYQEPKPQR